MQTDELSTVNILSLFQTNKAERKSFVDDVISRLESGEADAVKVHAQVKKMEEIVKSLNENKTYKNYLLDAAAKYGKKFSAFDAEWETRELGTKYDYSQCGDVEVTDLINQVETLSTKLKARQKFLQTLPVEGIDIITSDGEGVHIYPPSKSSTTGIVVTLK